ncbi:MAG: lysophospholipid acyltransferase family protein [Candidatus Taylorbacteria bacterium]|nr:lysophospholipid acyltransferase family protein [Candidatus Taylorbacteria bacterium]
MNFLRISQFLTWPIAFIYFNALYRIRINGRKNLRKIDAPFIVIANHSNFSDSFLFRLILGFATPHLPLRFMAVDRFDWRWLNFLADIGVIAFIYKLFGVFVIVPGRGIKKNLAEAKEIIGDGGNVVIFPEGKIVKDRAVAPFRPGATVLASETGAPVLPVSIRTNGRRFLRRDLFVNISVPVTVPAGADCARTTESFYKTIVGLYGRMEL